MRYDGRVQELRRITMDPQVMGGKPRIRGMRVTVGMIVEALAAGRTVEQLLGDFPYLEQPDICEYARKHGYVLLTNDLDFPQILAHTGDAGPSVVLLRGEPLVPELRGQALLEALADCEKDLAQGAIVSLDWSGRPRARVLPLR